jgi:tetratricopeptide (TPR) repeat protein
MRVRIVLGVVLAATLLFGLGAVIGRPSGGAAVPAGSGAPGGSGAPAPSGRLVAAIAAHQERLRRVPGDWTTWAALGEAYLEQSRVSADPAYYPKAEGALRKSLEVRPDGNAAALAGLGALANARHDFAAARALAQQAIAVNPWSDTAYGVLADAETQLGHPSEATAAVQQMLDLRPGLSSYARGSYDLEQHGKRTEAAALMRLALDSATEPADIAFCHQHLGSLAWAAGDLAAARSHVSLGLAADPGAVGLWQLRAKLDAAAGDLTAALSSLDKVVARTPTVDALLDQARLLRAAGRDPAPSLALARAALDLFTANGGTDDLGAAALALASGDAAGAARFALAEWDRRQFAEVADLAGWALLAAGDPAAALPFARRANALGQVDATLAYHYGMVAHALGDRETALVQLRLALALNPRFSPVDAPIAVRTLATLES